jgi:lipoate-protein ligase B
MSGLPIFYLHCIDYAMAVNVQNELAALRRKGEVGDCVLLLENPPTITLGRSSKAGHLLATELEIAERGIQVLETDRGGDITYHGPGQLVGYPIIDLTNRGRDLHAYLRDLEQALIVALDEFGVAARRFPPNTGVWVEDKKIAAIGIKVSHWITTHGFALNVDPDMRHFEMIVPCGIRDYKVTSLAAILARPVTVTDVIGPIVRALRATLGPVIEKRPDLSNVPELLRSVIQSADVL